MALPSFPPRQVTVLLSDRAGTLLGSLPVAFIYSFFVEYYVSGLTGSVKE